MSTLPQPSVGAALLNTGSISVLCWVWNLLTNPAKLRTEEQHEQARVDAKAVMSALKRRFTYGIDYTESEYSGRLIPCEKGGEA